MNEGFVKIPLIPEYYINLEGVVFSSHVNRVIKPYINNKGYKCIKLKVDGVTRTLSIHRLLAHVFLDLYDLWDAEKEVDHHNSDCTDNSVGNLNVLTKEEHRLKTILTAGKALVPTKFCSVCSSLLSKSTKGTLCIKHREPLSHLEVSAYDIEYWVTNFSWTRAAKELGLSDNGLRKRYSKLTGNDPKSLTRR